MKEPKSNSNFLDTLNKYENINEILFHYAKYFPEKECITVENSDEVITYTYKKLLERSLSKADLIRGLTAIGDRVVLPLGNSSEFIECYFGCLLSKRIPVPIPLEKSTSRFSRVKSVIEDCDPSLILFKNDQDFKLSNLSNQDLKKCNITILFNLAKNDERINYSFDEQSLLNVQGNSVALIQYTSGSTSNPKGVVLTHSNILSNIKMIQKGMEITPDDIVVSWLPLHHDMGLIGMLLTLVCLNSRAYIYSHQEFSRNPLSWLEKISQSKATISGAPNFAYDLVTKKIGEHNSKFDLSALRLLYCGSEKIQSNVIKSFYSEMKKHKLGSETFFPCYGLAEASLYVSGKYVNVDNLNNTPVTCGQPAAGLMIEIIDGGNVVPPGVVGEVSIKGDSVSSGYWHKIQSDVLNGDLKSIESNWVNTGDLGYIRNQELYICGRSKDMIKIRGRNIYAEDLEQAIEFNNPWVTANSVVAISIDHEGAEKLAVIIEIERSKRKEKFADLYNLIQQRLNEFELKADFIKIISPLSLPKTSSGKKQRHLTKQKLIGNELEVIDSDNPMVVESNGSENYFNVLKKIEKFKSYFDKINIDLADERRAFPAEFILKLKNSSLLSLLVPKEYGGLGLTNEEFSQVGAMLGEIDLSLGAMVGNHNTIGLLPLVYSNVLTDKKNVLCEIVKSGSLCSFAITEPGAGSNPRAIEGKLIRKSGKLYLTAEKVWIGNAQYADYITIFVKEFDEQGTEIGISSILLRRDTHKFEINPEQLTLGLKPMPQNRLSCNEIEVFEEDRLSKPGEGLKLAFKCMEYARFGLACLAVGSLKRALQITQGYVNDRKIWTGMQNDNDYISSEINLIKVKILAMQELISITAKSLSLSNSVSTTLTSVCKIIAGEWSFDSIDKCLQFCGGRGYTETFGLARIFRDSRIIKIFEGPTEALSYQIGLQLLRNPSEIEEKIKSELKIKILNFKEFKAIINAWSQIYKEKTVSVMLGNLFSEILTYSILEHSKAVNTSVAEGLTLNLIEDYKSKIVRLNLVQNETLTKVNTYFDLDLSNYSKSFYDDWSGLTRQAKVQKVDSSREIEPKVLKKIQLPSEDDTSINQNKIEELVCEWLRKNTRRTNIDSGKSMVNYGVDSLLAYELLCFVEEKYKVTLPETIIATKPSVADLSKFIYEKVLKG